MTRAGRPYGLPYTPGATQDRPQQKYVPAVLVAGKMVADLGSPRGAGTTWGVKRVTVSLTVPCAAYLYVGAANDPASLVDGTNSGGFDVSEYPVPLFVGFGQGLFVVWQSATGTGGARIDYVEV